MTTDYEFNNKDMISLPNLLDTKMKILELTATKMKLEVTTLGMKGTDELVKVAK